MCLPMKLYKNTLLPLALEKDKKLQKILQKNGFISMPLGTIMGRKEIADFMNIALNNISKEYLSSVETIFSHVENETGYIVYTAKPYVVMGTDTWHIRDRKILSQTYTSYPILDYVKEFFNKKQ